MRAKRALSSTQRSPFTPGQGAFPPYLAGRKSKQAVMRSRMEALADNDPLATNIILYGPRGNGKTVLMDWALRQARARKIYTISLSAAESQAKWGLLNELSMLPNWLGEILGRFRSASAPGTGDQMHAKADGPLAGMLRRRSRLSPVLLALDEAHMMDAEFGRDLFNIVWKLQREGCPVMLILAGTPDLPRHLSTLEASFWDRSERLPIGRLGPETSADAIRIPLEEGGRSITAAALEAAIGESDGYPYFLQLLGEAIWDAGPDPPQFRSHWPTSTAYGHLSGGSRASITTIATRNW